MKIYVGNLAEQTTDIEVREIFSAYGQVSRAVVIRDKPDGILRCFAFIEMPQTSEATLAIEKLNGHLFKDRLIKVKEARSRRALDEEQLKRTGLN